MKRMLIIGSIVALSMVGFAGTASAAPASASTTSSTTATATLSTPLLVVTVRAQGSNRFGVLYWEKATPSLSFDVFRDGKLIKKVSGSTTGNILYTDAVKGLRGTSTYKVCYSGTSTCSNSITVVYSSSTETIRYAPTCPTTGTARCIVTPT